MAERRNWRACADHGDVLPRSGYCTACEGIAPRTEDANWLRDSIASAFAKPLSEIPSGVGLFDPREKFGG